MSMIAQREEFDSPSYYFVAVKKGEVTGTVRVRYGILKRLNTLPVEVHSGKTRICRPFKPTGFR